MTKQGHVIMAPVAYYYPEDKNTWSIKDQLFFGENVMVGIVTEYLKRDMEVYLPAGEWYDFWSDEKIKGGKTITANAELDSTPIYIKAGSIMPYGPKIQHVDEVTDEPLDIKIYPSKDGEYTLYIDDKRSYDYENGEYSEVSFSYNNSKSTLSIKTTTDGYRNFSKEPLKLRISVAGKDGSQVVEYDGVSQNIKL